MENISDKWYIYMSGRKIKNNKSKSKEKKRKKILSKSKINWWTEKDKRIKSHLPVVSEAPENKGVWELGEAGHDVEVERGVLTNLPGPVGTAPKSNAICKDHSW